MSARFASTALAPLLALSLLAACGGGDEEGARGADTAAGDTTLAAASTQPRRVATTNRYQGDSAGQAAPVDFKTPESAKYDPELNVYYVSNINGNPGQKDGNGFIVRLRADSVAEAGTVLVQGGRNGVTLHAPKGMAIVGDTLWVADIDAVRAFDRRTGAPIASVNLAPRGAVFLNDIAVGPDGSLYITDTGIRIGANGEVTHPGPDRIFKITGRGASVAIQGDTLGRPNGITWDEANRRFVVVSFGGPNIMAWKPGERTTTVIATGPGTYDGVEVLADGRILVSSWADSSIHVVDGDSTTKLIGGVNAPADFGYNASRREVAIPLFSDNRIEYWTVPARR